MRTRFASALALLLAAMPLACGDDDGGTGDTPDASNIDANNIDAAPPTNTCGVQFLYEGSNAGVLVSFNAPDGSLIGTAVTDVDGMASRDDCVADTMVSMTTTYDFAVESAYTLYTIANVQPGDTVLIGSPGYDSPNTNAVISTPTNSSSGMSYDLYVGCNDSLNFEPGEDVSLSINSSFCRGRNPATYDAIAVSRDTSSFPPYDITSYAMATDIPVVPGADSPGTLGPWTNVSSSPMTTVTLTNQPTQGTSVFLKTFQLRDGVSFRLPPVDAEIPPFFEIFGIPFELGTGEDPSFTFPALPHAFADSQAVQMLVFYGFITTVYGAPTLPPTGVSLGLAQTAAASTSSITTDMSATLLPRLAGVFVSTENGLSRPRVTWLSDGVSEDTDGVWIGFAYGPGFPDEQTDFVRGKWIVLTSNAAEGSFTMPVLPDTLAGAAPHAGEVPTVMFGSMYDTDGSYHDQLTTGLNLFPNGLTDFLGLNKPRPAPDFLRRSATWVGPYFLEYYFGDGPP